MLFQQRMSIWQLTRVPSRQPMPNRLRADLRFRHWRNDLVVDEQAIDEQRLFARRVGRLELDRLAALRILNAGEQSRFEQFRFVFEFLHVAASLIARMMASAYSAPGFTSRGAIRHAMLRRS